MYVHSYYLSVVVMTDEKLLTRLSISVYKSSNGGKLVMMGP